MARRSSIAFGLFLVFAATVGASYGCAKACGVPFDLSWDAFKWEAKEFWRKTVVPIRDWKKNADADEGDIAELNPPSRPAP